MRATNCSTNGICKLSASIETIPLPGREYEGRREKRKRVRLQFMIGNAAEILRMGAMMLTTNMEDTTFVSTKTRRCRRPVQLAGVGLAMGFAFFLGVGAARADGVDLGCDPDNCGTVQVPPCDNCGDHSIGTDGGAGAAGQPINGDNSDNSGQSTSE